MNEYMCTMSLLNVIVEYEIEEELRMKECG
jgi:hypothetical protein